MSTMLAKQIYFFDSSALASKDRIMLIDLINELRSYGISQHFSLPQIIVVGDQSSGKSATLEAIIGFPFPVKGSLCTCFPSEIILRRSLTLAVKVSIVPDQSRPDNEKIDLGLFQGTLDSLDGFESLIGSAKEAMGVSPEGKAFSKDLLRVEISGPECPHLTIVDLPGLIHSETKYQSASDVRLIQELVASYMKEPRSIILAVVSAKNDFANQIVLSLARDYDPTGTRTLGVITKPDTLAPGHNSEAQFVSLAKNLEVDFRLGWHVLKNLDSEKQDELIPDRDASENQFFRQGKWRELPPSTLGISHLRRRLKDVLLGHIVSELPSLMKEIEMKRTSSSEMLKKLGQPRDSFQKQLLYLVQISQEFSNLVSNANDGIYSDPFFDDAETDRGYQQRFRAVIRNLNDTFSLDLAKHGHRRQISDPGTCLSGVKTTMEVTQTEYIKHVKAKMHRSRGRELPGLFDPMIVADLFRDQVSPWADLATAHVRKVWSAAKTFLRHVICHVADEATATALMKAVFEPAMNGILATLLAKTDTVLHSHTKLHPITCNSHFIENIMKIRTERQRTRYTKIIQSFYEKGPRLYSDSRDAPSLVNALMEDVESDMNEFTAMEAMNYMIAYYQVSMARFVDDLAVEVIEVNLVRKMGDILTAVSVNQMSTELITRVAGESEENRVHRDQLSTQLEVLNKGVEVCKRLVGVDFGNEGDLTDNDINNEEDKAEPGGTGASQISPPMTPALAPRPSPPEHVVQYEVPVERYDGVKFDEDASSIQLNQAMETEDEWFSSKTRKTMKKKKGLLV